MSLPAVPTNLQINWRCCVCFARLFRQELQVFKKEAGERLEAAFRTGRTSVPLAGLEDPLEGAIAACLT